MVEKIDIDVSKAPNGTLSSYDSNAVAIVRVLLSKIPNEDTAKSLALSSRGSISQLVSDLRVETDVCGLHKC